MRKIILLLFLSFCFQISSAQYTELINSKRPGFSDSPYSVGTGVYQVEAGLFYKNIGNGSFSAPKSSSNLSENAVSQTFQHYSNVKTTKFSCFSFRKNFLLERLGWQNSIFQFNYSE